MLSKGNRKTMIDKPPLTETQQKISRQVSSLLKESKENSPQRVNDPLFGGQHFLPVIESIATGTPETIVSQKKAADFVAGLPRLEKIGKKNRSRIEKLYANTRIETRHFALDVTSNEAIALSNRSATIEERMGLFRSAAVPLAYQVSLEALSSAQAAAAQSSNAVDIKNDIKDDIRMVVFVSSTGFVGPGVDAHLIEQLGLRRDTARAAVSFMGCAAAINGLRVASDHVRAYPNHKVLLVCLELSSVNVAFDDNMNDVITHSIFGDGCAAVVIGACEATAEGTQGKLIVRAHLSHLVEGTEDGITLGVRDNGITCKLSRHLPDYIEAGVGPVIQQFLNQQRKTTADIDLWAVHPGGTRIIQKAQSALGLSDEQVADSWAILKTYGNMLSVSILFVIARMMNRLQANEIKAVTASTTVTTPMTGLGFSFSPGVGIEGVLFEKH